MKCNIFICFYLSIKQSIYETDFTLLLAFTSSFIFAQDIITKEVGTFNELKVYDLIEVNLIQSDENKVVIKGDDTQDVVIVNKDGKLKLRMATDQISKATILL